MRRHLISILALLVSHSLLCAEDLFVGSINFRGESEGDHFRSREFDVKFEAGNFRIIQHREGGDVFVIERDDNSILDLVFSPDRSVVAAAMRATDPKKRQRALVVVDSDGQKKTFEYTAYEMTERLGWVVELGSVSDDGALILAKCALMLPENKDGVSRVQHEWVVLEMSDAKIKIIESVDSIDKWAKYAETPTGEQ